MRAFVKSVARGRTPARLAACAAMVIIAGLASGSPAAGPTGDPAKGQKVFARCMACHKIDASNTSGLGPNLNGVVGRRAGTLKGFRYSTAMAGSARVWNEATLDAYLAAPARNMPGNRMAFPGLSKPDERRDVIAYIRAKTK
jgi:cytochrome c